MSDEKKEEKKKYTVVDRRRGDDEAPAPEEPKEAPRAAAPEENEPGDFEGGEQRSIAAGDVMRIVLGLLREHALLRLGLIVGPPEDAPALNPEEAARTAEIFRAMVAKRRVDLQQETPDKLPNAGLRETLVFAFQMLHSQVFIFLGLIADPVTNLVTKRVDQAKICIDFFAELLEVVQNDLEPADLRSLEGLIADLRINYVKQANTA